MALSTYYKPFPNRKILEGVAVVMPTPGNQSGTFSFVAEHTVEEAKKHDNLDNYDWAIALNNRFLVAPSGWNA